MNGEKKQLKVNVNNTKSAVKRSLIAKISGMVSFLYHSNMYYVICIAIRTNVLLYALRDNSLMLDVTCTVFHVFLVSIKFIVLVVLSRSTR